ncbi:ABC transporter ATP-binding protein [Phytoactinopolyspora halotolerans]|uniref:ABC transporter ATP-binding protein n=1 Tax=Phytoactinopolyspora halotolerans TaxID=1981512 RepID=A0A6L9S5U0_9ACTN|nr:ABC transporter ATP-binding protein [Phytoactinopolyspora halotolerans]NEE00353.1 ABC transporter ATP-binding protein [Phytoactinopolyspora halotolerans]
MMNYVGDTTAALASQQQEHAIQIRDLRVVRGERTVLDGLDLTVGRGSITGLLGPSGSGKSTLMRAIIGVQKIVSGKVTVLGAPAGSVQLRDRVAYVTQAPSVYQDLTVRQNLAYFADVLGAPRSDVDRAIDQVDLASYADKLAANLSGGQFSRVSLAVALLGHPELLVLDEPTVGLDPVLRKELWDLFGRIASDGATLLVSSHVMDEAQRCDDLILLREGGMVLAHDTLSNLLERTGAADAEHAFLQLVSEEEIHA